MPHAAAIERAQLRPMTPAESADWSEWRARWEAVSVEAGSPPDMVHVNPNSTADVEHAAAKGGGTLCGLPESSVDLYRHLFDATRTYACEQCATAACE